MRERTDASRQRRRRSRKRHRTKSKTVRPRRERTSVFTSSSPSATSSADNTHPGRSTRPRGAPFEQLVDVGLLAVLFLAPLFMGGRHPLGRLVVVSIVCATAVTWIIGQCTAKSARWIPTGATVLLAGGLLVVLFQLAPLPYWLVAELSPSTAELLPAWSPEGGIGAEFGAWPYISLMPQATRHGLGMYLCYAMLFLLVVQRLRRLEDVERWTQWIALAAVFLTLVGLAQYFAGNGRYLWIYEHPFRGPDGAVRGPFVNPNHFAHFLSLGIGPLCWCMYRAWCDPGGRGQTQLGHNVILREWQQFRKPATIVVVTLVALAALLTLSRGGIVAVSLAAAVCAVVYAFGRLFGRRSVLAFVCAGGAIVASVFMYGRQVLTQELDSIAESESLEDLSYGRKKLWEADSRAVSDFPFLGTGIGSHRVVYPMYLEEKHDVTYTHAENGYLQILLEAGIVGLALLLGGIGLCVWWCVQTFRQSRSPQVIACLGAIAGGLTASVLHSFVDFAWYIPACMSLTVVLAACACRLRQVTRAESGKPTDGVRLPRIVWVVSSVAIVGVSIPMIGALVGPAQAAPYSDRYRAIAREGTGVYENDPESIDVCTAHLELALERNPADERAHLNLAHLCLRKFHLEQESSDVAMPLIQIRDAALASSFPSREALDRWLTAATGDRYQYLQRALSHSRQAVRLCPLQGEGYVYLAELVFLEGRGEQAKRECISQAIKVRPHSAAVSFAVGREAALACDFSNALDHFKTAFDKDKYFRARIIELFAGQDADFFLRHFDPDLSTLGTLRSHYRGIGRNEDARKIGIRYVAMLRQAANSSTGEEAAGLWLESQRVYDDMGAREQAFQSAKKAVEAAPNHFQSRRNLATVLLDEEQYDAAIPHLRWCLLRYPGNDELKKELDLAKRNSAAADHTPLRRRY